MSKSRYPYPPDEFDAAAPQGAPVGVHRAPRSAWSKTWPFILVALIFAGLAYAVFALVIKGDGLAGFGSASKTPSASASVTSSTPPESAEPSTEPTDTATSDPATEEPSETQTSPSEPADFTLPVRVLNGSGIAGLATAGAQMLTDAGYTNASTGNYSGEALGQNVVYYQRTAQESTALDVATKFGIPADAVQYAPDQTAGITVIFMSDYRG